MGRRESPAPPGDTGPLVRRWKAKGNPALEPLYERFGADLRKHIQRIVKKNPPRGYDTEDLMHEVWGQVCRIHGKELELSNPGAFRALLQKIAESTISSLFRTQRAQKRNRGERDQPLDTRARREGTPVHGPYGTRTPSQVAIEYETFERVRAALPEKTYEAWYLRVKGYSPSELEEVLGLSERQIRRLYREGMKCLGEILGE